MARETIRLDLGDTAPPYSWRTAIANATNDGTISVTLGRQPSRVAAGLVRLAPGETSAGYDYGPANSYPELYVGSITATGFTLEFRNVKAGNLVLWYDAL